MRYIIRSVFCLPGLSLLFGLFALPLLAAAFDVRQSTLPDDIRQNGFVYCVSGTLSTLNPQIASSDIIVDTLSEQLYDRLLSVDPYSYQLVPELAERWEILQGGASYLFYLRHNIPFHSTSWFKPSRTLTADDVLFSFQRIFNRDHPYHSVNGGSYPYFDSLGINQNTVTVKKLDDYRVLFTLPQPDASFLWHLATHYAPILSAEYADLLQKEGKMPLIDQLPVGTGPYSMHNYHQGHYLRLSYHRTYWKGTPHMQQVVIDLGASGTGRIAKLLTGECDVLAYPAASQFKLLRNDARLQFSQSPAMNIAYLAFNTRKSPLNDRRVRQAIALAINNVRLMHSIYYDLAKTATSILPALSWAHDSAAQVTGYDPIQARRLLQEAGVYNLHLSLWVPIASRVYNASPLKMAELLQTDMAQAGITVTIVPVENRLYNGTIKNESANNGFTKRKEYDLLLSGWSSSSLDPDSFLRPLLSCAAIDSHTNQANWCNPLFDQLLDNALRSQELIQRSQEYIAAQRILEQELPLLPLASSLQLQAFRYSIKGIVVSSLGTTSFATIYRQKNSISPKGE